MSIGQLESAGGITTYLTEPFAVAAASKFPWWCDYVPGSSYITACTTAPIPKAVIYPVPSPATSLLTVAPKDEESAQATISDLVNRQLVGQQSINASQIVPVFSPITSVDQYVQDLKDKLGIPEIDTTTLMLYAAGAIGVIVLLTRGGRR